MLVDVKGSLKVTEDGLLRVSEAFSQSLATATELEYIQREIAEDETVTIEETVGMTMILLQSDVEVTLYLEGEVTGHAVTFFLASGDFAAGIAVAASEDAVVKVIAAR